ncbi:DUF4293 domain-containing protein [bacterium SCSIO 12643]|nr:DUF4293 domain-containing protein [bacterium SCSIO 12643]
MIQRIQSLYLLAAIVLNIAILISGMFYISNGTQFMIVGAFGIKEGDLVIDQITMIPVVALAIVNILIGGYAISQFKNRKMQANLAKLGMLITVIIMGWIGYAYFAYTQMDLTIRPFIGILHSPVILFAFMLALRGINKDEALVKSVDRLR